MKAGAFVVRAALFLTVSGCHTGGRAWINEPLTPEAQSEDEPASDADLAPRAAPAEATGRMRGFHVRSIGGEPHTKTDAPSPGGGLSIVDPRRLEGRILGKFRNTYYNFPSEREFASAPGPRSLLKDAECKTLAEVPKNFHDAVCVQGSGRLTSGMTVSFAKRDCACAEVCPRSGERICFEALRPEAFPWGRGAAGSAITPLLTVAVDTKVIPMGTGIYIPEYDGAPLDLEGGRKHDGCFIAQDRGIRVKGDHVDVFTGEPALTKLYNALVPSNRGVTIVLNSPRCSRADSSL